VVPGAPGRAGCSGGAVVAPWSGDPLRPHCWRLPSVTGCWSTLGRTCWRPDVLAADWTALVPPAERRRSARGRHRLHGAQAANGLKFVKNSQLPLLFEERTGFVFVSAPYHPPQAGEPLQATNCATSLHGQGPEAHAPAQKFLSPVQTHRRTGSHLSAEVGCTSACWGRREVSLATVYSQPCACQRDGAGCRELGTAQGGPSALRLFSDTHATTPSCLPIGCGRHEEFESARCLPQASKAPAPRGFA